MQRHTKLLSCCLALVLIQIGCSAQSRSLDEPAANTAASVNKAKEFPTPEQFKVLTTATESDFLGCWSSGSGKTLRLTNDQIFLSTNSFKPVDHTDAELEDGRLLIRLVNRPQFYFLSKIVSFELDADRDPMKDFALHIWDYDTDEDLSKGEPTGRSAWVKSDCKPWMGDAEAQ